MGIGDWGLGIGDWGLGLHRGHICETAAPGRTQGPRRKPRPRLERFDSGGLACKSRGGLVARAFDQRRDGRRHRAPGRRGRKRPQRQLARHHGREVDKFPAHRRRRQRTLGRRPGKDRVRGPASERDVAAEPAGHESWKRPPLVLILRVRG